MNETFRASLIVVTYNCIHTLQDCLKSLTDESGPDCELIVVDNASTDGTPELIRGQFPNVTLLHNSSNRGFGPACNLAAREAHGDMLCFVNPDVIVSSGWLEGLLLCLRKEKIAATASPIIMLKQNPTQLNAFGNNVHLSGLTYSPAHFPAQINSYPLLTVFSGACFVVRRTLFEQVGGFCEDYFLYYEDTDLAIRLRQLGYQHLAVPEVRIWHEYTPSFTADKIFNLERNRQLSWLSLLPWWALLLSSPAWILAELMIWAFCLLHGRAYFLAKAQAWHDVFAHREWMLARRRTLKGADHRWLADLTPLINLQYLHKGLISHLAEGLLFFSSLPSILIIKIVVFLFSKEKGDV